MRTGPWPFALFVQAKWGRDSASRPWHINAAKKSSSKCSPRIIETGRLDHRAEMAKTGKVRMFNIPAAATASSLWHSSL